MKIIMIGVGNVGRSFLNLLSETRTIFNKQILSEVKIVAVLDRKGGAIDKRGLDPKLLLAIKQKDGTIAATPKVGQFGLSAKSVIREIEADVILELTPTNPINTEPAISNIKIALENGKHAITTNKSPPAFALQELQKLALLNDLYFRFSGTVGGGTPILEFVRQIADSDEILSLKAILNGTTNYILSRMYDKQMTLDESLKEAQRLGYAEKDPSLDLEGIDPALKLAIIANYALGRRITLNDIQITGVTDVSVEKVQENKKKGKKVKLICSIDSHMTVAPEPIEVRNRLCVDGGLNAVLLKTKYTGEMNLTGPGAGGYPTATAILNDLIFIEKAIEQDKFKSEKRIPRQLPEILR